MASIYKRAPLFKNQKTWSEKTPLGDVYKLQSNNPHNNFKAEIHKDSGNLGIEFTLDKTIDDIIRGAEKVNLDNQGSFLEFENVLQGHYLTDWKQVLHEHFPEPLDPLNEVPAEQDRSSAINFKRAINLFLIKTLNEKMPWDRQYIYLAPRSRVPQGTTDVANGSSPSFSGDSSHFCKAPSWKYSRAKRRITGAVALYVFPQK
jgi:hypothetical protein